MIADLQHISLMQITVVDAQQSQLTRHLQHVLKYILMVTSVNFQSKHKCATLLALKVSQLMQHFMVIDGYFC